tara:strand:+ start:268 stop:1377 length:1110 start_codon:yes stop_codon:yes gene_type:complete
MIFNKFFRKYDFSMVLALSMLPLASIAGIPLYIYYNGIVWQEPVILAIGWFLAGSGITMGYHRLFAHKAFKAKPVLEWILMLCGSMALQNTIVKWCSDHRRHHKKLDTKEDPYSIKKGFFHAHIGWILKKGDDSVGNISDLKKKSAVKFQDKYYWSIALFLSFVLPLLIGLLYGRPIGGLLWGGILRVTLVHHFTFLINSLCHYLGKKDYELNTTARDSWITAIFTFGEGYHNYHHKFQWDYRNGIKWYSFDPSKWIIGFLSIFKITYSLKKVSKQHIMRARINTLNKKIENLNFNNIYLEKIQKITDDAMKNLELWKNLELKYKSIKKIEISKYKRKFYKQKVKLYNTEAQRSLSALMIMFVNLKNLN